MHHRSGNIIAGRHCLLLIAACIAVRCDAAPPRVTNDRYKLELVASEPEIVTPVGMAFDRRAGCW